MKKAMVVTIRLPIRLFSYLAIKLKRAIMRFIFIIARILFGLSVAIEILGVAFIFFIDVDLARIIRSSILLRTAILLGVITTIVILSHAIKHDWPYLDIIYLTFQAARICYFIAPPPEENE